VSKKPKKILLIEDNPGDARLIREMLEKENFQFHLEWADRLQTGMELLDTEDIDLVLLDFGLPDSQGLDGFEKIHSRKPNVPVIAITGLDDEKVSTEGIRRGLQDCLIKGKVEGILLLRTINYAIERQRLQSELERFTEELRNSEVRLLNTIEQNIDGIIIMARNGVVRFINPAAESLLGLTAENIIGDLFEFRIAEGFSAVKDEVAEISIIRKNKETVLAEMRLAETVWENEPCYIVSLRDVTERKLAEEEREKLFNELEESYKELQHKKSLLIQTEHLVQTEKMSAVGTMVAGVAHELNNPMMGILHFAQYCLKHTTEDDRRYTVLQDLERETKRCIKIVQNLLSFSRLEREGEEAYQKESCVVIFDRVFRLLSYRIEKQNVLVKKNYAEKIPKIWIKTNSIQQVFFNIVNNALDAIGENGKKEIHIDIHLEDEFVRVIIADSGEGISPENLKKIFDPFYTTKPVGEGTGLGLSICLNIIKAHGGKITCESKLGKGTKFKVLFPIERRKN
jgi:two-component system cell cycle sensor histidine kinase/response regulator CckA